MSTAGLTSAWKQGIRVGRHFVTTRGVEVGALQASPLLGAYLGGISKAEIGPVVLLLLGSAALTAHVFVFNDWADYERDRRVDRPANAAVGALGITRTHIAVAAGALLILAMALLAFVGMAALVVGAGIALLSFLYSTSAYLGKRMPIAASLNHVAGGALHFLLGYTATHTLDLRGIALGLFFALVFAAGHLNQEVRDYEFDQANGIRTSAVVFGRGPAFFASCVLFTAAYVTLATLAWFALVPKTLFFVAVAAWLIQGIWSVRASRTGLNRETALWMQRRYRAMFAMVGLAILVV